MPKQAKFLVLERGGTGRTGRRLPAARFEGESTAMFMFENRITIEDRQILEKYLGSYEYRASGLSFTSLYMWRDVNGFSWKQIGDYLCIAGVSQFQDEVLEPFLLPPLTAAGVYEPESLRETILEAKRLFEEAGYIFSLRLLPFHMVDCLRAAFPTELKIIADRPNYDYVYLTKDLINLAGRAYHAKKNHLNYFKNHYRYEYVHLTEEMVPQAKEFIREFNRRKGLTGYEGELLLMEQQAMEDVFEHLEEIGYLAGAILIDGNIEALAIGGRLGKKTVTVHVEKANTEIRGLYQAINNEFCKQVSDKIKYINREEDMGMEGLRKAKLSYNPVKMVEKYIAIFKEDL